MKEAHQIHLEWVAHETLDDMQRDGNPCKQWDTSQITEKRHLLFWLGKHTVYWRSFYSLTSRVPMLGVGCNFQPGTLKGRNGKPLQFKSMAPQT